MRLSTDMMKSSKPEMQKLLDSGYKMLLIVGNFDVITGHLGVQRIINSLTVAGNKVLSDDVEWEVWKVKEKIAGYRISSSESLKLLVVRNAGHAPLLDKPEWIWSEVSRFIDGTESCNVDKQKKEEL